MSGKGGKRDLKREKTEDKMAVTFKPAHIKRQVKQQTKMRVSRDALKACSAAITYIMLEVMEAGRTYCQADNKKKMSPKHINAAITTDPELRVLFRSYVIQAGGGRQYKVSEGKSVHPEAS